MKSIKRFYKKFSSRKTPPSHIFIDISDEHLEFLIDKYSETFKWLIKKDNRFKYTACNGPIDFMLFDAYDKSYKDYREYLNDHPEIMYQQYELGLDVNKYLSRYRESFCRKPIKARTKIINKSKKVR